MAIVKGTVLKGHRVASGQSTDPRYPQGTIAMQVPKFFQLGLDLLGFYRGTVNVSVSPLQFKVIKPLVSFNDVKWSDNAPPEDFSFCDAKITLDGKSWYTGYVYYPHPETKPEHFQSPGVLELIMHHIPGIQYGTELTLDIPEEQIVFFE